MQSIRKWIEFWKISTFFLPQKSLFLRKNSKNWTYLTGIYDFFRIIIWKFSNFMKPINPEKISANSLIWLRNWQGIFRGEFSGHLETIKRSLQGVRGAKDGSEVSFFKTIQSIWKWIHFSKNVNIFLLQKINFLKNLEKLNIFYKNFWIFSNTYFKFSFFTVPYKSREILCEFKYPKFKFPPGRLKIFENLQKNFLRKLQ